MKALLVFSGFRYEAPDVAECEVEGRTTKTMFVVEKTGPVKMLIEGHSPVRCVGVKRFRLQTGRQVGYGSMIHTWVLRYLKS